MRLAHFVPDGRVYGIDTEPDMVKYLGDRGKAEVKKAGYTLVRKLAFLPNQYYLIFQPGKQ